MLRAAADDYPCVRVDVDTPAFLAGDSRGPDRPAGVGTRVREPICSCFQGRASGDIRSSVAAERTGMARL